jgi:carbamoyltransferase
MTAILGISGFYHDSAAALIRDGDIVAAAQEERFSRKKHDARFPRNAIRYCLEEAGMRMSEVDYAVFYDKPLVKFERMLETYLAYAPEGFKSFLSAMPAWLKEKLYLKGLLREEIAGLGDGRRDATPRLLFTEHHQSHAASAFFASPYRRAAVMCLDGVGEWATSSVWQGDDNTLTPLWEIDFPHSLGLLYSAFTYYTGFKVNSGEYKLMGLAPYGEPRFVAAIQDHLLDVREDGSFHLNMDYFNYATGLTMTNERFATLFGGPPRRPESPLEQRHMDLARSIQAVTEEVVLRLARSVHRETGNEHLCLAGGVALNCVANGRIQREGPFKGVWIQPAAGDAGGALGAALAVWHQFLGKPRYINGALDGMKGAYLGPRYRNDDIRAWLDSVGARYRYLQDEQLFPFLADILAQGNIVGWMQGRMEFGPRALGARSILGDPRNTRMQSIMNLKIKFRESFRPFAPSILAERVSDYFAHQGPSPYMLITAPVRGEIRIPMNEEQKKLFGIDKLNVPRSSLPAVTHVDYSARIQTVHEETNPRYYALLRAFERKTGCPVLVNTSFNVRGEPIVCTPEDSYRCFMRTEMDYLVLENFILAKPDQPAQDSDEAWKSEFELD